jgi:hypothetical protein
MARAIEVFLWAGVVACIWCLLFGPILNPMKGGCLVAGAFASVDKCALDRGAGVGHRSPQFLGGGDAQ